MAAVVRRVGASARTRSVRSAPLGPAIGAIAPHDDSLYAGRVLRRALERIEANTVVDHRNVPSFP
jgi:hypothetical protein